MSSEFKLLGPDGPLERDDTLALGVSRHRLPHVCSPQSHPIRGMKRASQNEAATGEAKRERKRTVGVFLPVVVVDNPPVDGVPELCTAEKRKSTV